jgi:hypothetical protein
MRCAAATLPGNTSISPAKDSKNESIQTKITMKLHISRNTKMEIEI